MPAVVAFLVVLVASLVGVVAATVFLAFSFVAALVVMVSLLLKGTQ